MPSPNAFYVGDELLHGSGPLATKVTVAAFVKPAGGRQLVRVRFPDHSYRNVGFDSLRRLPLLVKPSAAEAAKAEEIARDRGWLTDKGWNWTRDKEEA